MIWQTKVKPLKQRHCIPRLIIRSRDTVVFPVACFDHFPQAKSTGGQRKVGITIQHWGGIRQATARGPSVVCYSPSALLNTDTDRKQPKSMSCPLIAFSPPGKLLLTRTGAKVGLEGGSGVGLGGGTQRRGGGTNGYHGDFY